jgi:hypothetical protein
MAYTGSPLGAPKLVLFDSTNGTIRDTAAHTSKVGGSLQSYHWVGKLLWLHNGTNQSLSITPQVSPDYTTWLTPPGAPAAQTVAAGAWAAVDPSVWTFLTYPYNYLQLTATASVAPTTGELDAFLVLPTSGAVRR